MGTNKERIMVFAQEATVPVDLYNGWTHHHTYTNSYVCATNNNRPDVHATMVTIASHVRSADGPAKYSRVFHTDVCGTQPTVQTVNYAGHAGNRPYYHGDMIYTWGSKPRGWRV